MSRNLRMSEEQYAEKKKRGRAPMVPIPTEHQEQAAFFKWWREYAPLKHIHVKLCFCIPNSSALSATGRLYKWNEGLTAGVSDIFLAIPKGGYHGLFIEMKRTGSYATADQKEFSAAVSEKKYATALCYSSGEAIDKVQGYLSVELDYFTSTNP